MRYWDNDFDRQFDEALDELIKQNCQGYTDEQLEEMYQDHLQRINIGNAQKLIGAQ